MTRDVAFPEQEWEMALALSPLEPRGIDAPEGCDPVDVASRMLRVPLSTRHMPSSERRAVIERHLLRHGGLWFVYWGKFVTDDRGLITGIQEGTRTVSARRVSFGSPIVLRREDGD